MRKIIHIDMDAFFASVEQRDNPSLRGKPVIVGGRPNERGVVATASYEARPYGVRSAMPTRTALRLCPQALVVRPRMEAYREVSRRIRAIFADYTSVIEPMSLDEAYLDVSLSSLCRGSATLMAEEIRARIRSELQLTASAGVSYNKFLAKVASDCQKPDGITVITPEHGAQFAAELAIGKFWGIGKVTEGKMHQLGIRTGSDLLQHDPEALRARFHKSADFYLQLARGVDHRPVQTKRVRKSVGREQTFSSDIASEQQMLVHLQAYAQELHAWCQQRNKIARTLTLKARYANFRTVTRSQSLDGGYTTLQHIHQTLPQLLASTQALELKVRLLGLSLSNFVD